MHCRGGTPAPCNVPPPPPPPGCSWTHALPCSLDRTLRCRNGMQAQFDTHVLLCMFIRQDTCIVMGRRGRGGGGGGGGGRAHLSISVSLPQPLPPQMDAVNTLIECSEFPPSPPPPPPVLAEAKGKLRLTMSFSLITLNGVSQFCFSAMIPTTGRLPAVIQFQLAVGSSSSTGGIERRHHCAFGRHRR